MKYLHNTKGTPLNIVCRCQHHHYHHPTSVYYTVKCPYNHHYHGTKKSNLKRVTCYAKFPFHRITKRNPFNKYERKIKCTSEWKKATERMEKNSYFHWTNLLAPRLSYARQFNIAKMFRHKHLYMCMYIGIPFKTYSMAFC